LSSQDKQFDAILIHGNCGYYDLEGLFGESFKKLKEGGKLMIQDKFLLDKPDSNTDTGNPSFDIDSTNGSEAGHCSFSKLASLSDLMQLAKKCGFVQLRERDVSNWAYSVADLITNFEKHHYLRLKDEFELSEQQIKKVYDSLEEEKKNYSEGICSYTLLVFKKVETKSSDEIVI